MVATTEKANTIYTNTNLTGPIAFIMGSEDTGIDQRLLALADEQVKIPVLSKIELQNVSVPPELRIYEVIRQRSLEKL